MRFAAEIADDVGPFARRGERDRARPLANREAFDGLERDIGLGRKTLAERFEQAGAHWARLGLAGDADEQRRGGGRAAMGVHGLRQSQWLSNGHGAKSEVCRASSTLLGRPSGGLAESIGARQVSWLAAYRRRRLPGPAKAQWRESVGTPLTVAGAATDRRKAYRVPFSPSFEIEGPCAGHVPASARGCQMKDSSACARLRSLKPRRPWFRACDGRGSKYRSKSGPRFGGQLFERSGGRTSRPEQRSQLPQGCDFGFRGDGFQAGTAFSASAGRLPAPNNVSAN